MKVRHWKETLAFFVLMGCTPCGAYEIPKPTNYVNDFAGMLPQQAEDSLNAKLSRYEKSSSVEIAVLTLARYEDVNTDIADLAQYVFEEWGIGKKGSDNGALLVVCEEAHEWWIQTGYGLEGLLPDATCKRLGETLLVPSFRAGDYAGGVERTVDGMMAKIGYRSADIQKFKDEQAAAKEQKKKALANEAGNVGIMVLVLAMLGFLVYMIVDRRNRRLKLASDVKASLDHADQLVKRAKDVLEGIDTDHAKNLLDEADGSAWELSRFDGQEASETLIEKIKVSASVLEALYQKASKYGAGYRLVANDVQLLQEAERRLLRTDELLSYLEPYGTRGKKTNDLDHVKKLLADAKEASGTEKLLPAVDKLLAYTGRIQKSQEELEKAKAEVLRIHEELKKYKETIEYWISKLKSHGLTSAITNVENSAAKLEATLAGPESALFAKHDVLQSIVSYAEREFRKAEEEEARKKREKEEEEAARRSRAATYTSTTGYSPYRSSSSSSGSFGGFGGGHSGGGGAGGRW